jgi:hypothetical protein
MGHIALCTVALGLSFHSASLAEVVSLESDPPGTYMSIEGPVSLSGNAPLSIAELPVGEYYLTANGPGLPTVKGRFVRSEDGIIGRSWVSPTAFVLPPGFVHLERGEKRGWAFASAGAVSATMSIVSQASVKNAKDNVERASLAYGWALSEEAIRNARLDLLAATWEKEDYEELRNLWIGYFALTWLSASVEAVLLTPQPAFPTTTAGSCIVALPRAGGMRAAARSALVPGAGQRFMGRDGRANFFFGATAAFAAGAIAAHDKFLEARRDQADAQRRFNDAQTAEDLAPARDRLQEAADRTQDKNTLRWALVGVAAGAYLWNVFDAFGLGNEIKVPELTWSVAPASDGVLVCATWSIP